MRVMVTGGTGFVGAYAVAALLDAGHTPRLLIRNRDRLRANVAPLRVDVDRLDVVMGDMTDADAVAAAVDGCDAAIHAAAVVATLNRADADRVIDLNVAGTRTVVGAALAAGCARVVHVSSTAAVFDPSAPVLTADLPPAIGAASPYTRSKALADAWVREQQADGKPVTLVYPGGVSGPAAGEAIGEVASGFISMLKAGLVVLSDGRITVIDVRDLASVLVASLSSRPGPRRYMAGGRLTTLADIGTMLRQLTGRRMPVLPTPGVVFRSLGRIVDAVRRVVPVDTVFTAEAMALLTLAQPTDDSLVHSELGVSYRPTEETVEAMVRGLYAAGRLSARQVGQLAAALP